MNGPGAKTPLEYNDDPLTPPPRRRREKTNWITSYADMITLLLVFFIIITASSKMTATQFEKIQKTMSGEKAESTITRLVQDLTKIMEKHGIQDFVQIVEEEDGVKMMINDNLLFDSGQADISKNNQSRFQPILGALKDLPSFYTFSIEGHTDDAPIGTAQFPSNWHLSTGRAMSVLDMFLREGFQEERLSLHGLGSTQPMAPNRTPEGVPILENRKKNRRVVIRIR